MLALALWLLTTPSNATEPPTAGPCNETRGAAAGQQLQRLELLLDLPVP
jgi:hypothetical protein